MNLFDLRKSDKKLAILIDPDKHEDDRIFDFLHDIKSIEPDYIFVGGSLIFKSSVEEVSKKIKAVSSCPLVLFPGHFTQLNHSVDAVLLLSLISGRNADLLIGQHVLAAPMLRQLGEKVVATGYMLIDGGRPTSVSYMSNTQPIPSDKTDIAVCTAIAGQYLGCKCIYMDAGSGASTGIPQEMVRGVADAIDVPLIVGGGIRSIEHIEQCWSHGANLVVIGNWLEENTRFKHELLLLREKGQGRY